MSGTPVRPMLAKSEEELPLGSGWRYEPKWDGFRAIVTRDAGGVRIDSRGDRPLGRYFPELVALLNDQSPSTYVMDGEILMVVDTPWAAQWRDAIESLKTGVRKGVDRAVFRETETFKGQKFLGIEPPGVNEEILAAVQAKINALMPALKSAKVRKLWETDSPENAAAAVKKKMEGQRQKDTKVKALNTEAENEEGIPQN